VETAIILFLIIYLEILRTHKPSLRQAAALLSLLQLEKVSTHYMTVRRIAEFFNTFSCRGLIEKTPPDRLLSAILRYINCPCLTPLNFIISSRSQWPEWPSWYFYLKPISINGKYDCDVYCWLNQHLLAEMTGPDEKCMQLYLHGTKTSSLVV